MVNIAILEENKKKGTLRFSLEKTTPAFANALRRAMIEDVPTMAIEKVEFSKNNSILYDEVLAHRLGLTPLVTDLKTYNLQEGCKCKGEGCARCTLEFSLKIKGPATVKAGLLESKDPKIVPVYPETLLAKLKKTQEIELIATAILGKGKDHVKWCPGNVWYSYKPIIKVNNKSPKLAEFKDKYPSVIFDAKGKINEKMFDKPEIRDACEGVCDDIIKIEYDESSFVFHVESWGQLPCREIVTKALEILDEKMNEFNDAVKNI